MKEKLKKIGKFIIDNLFFISCICCMFLVKIVYIYSLKNQYTYDYGNLPIVMIVIFTITYIITLIRKRGKISIIDVLIYISIILNIISTKNAIQPDIALYGNDRQNGLLVLLVYSLLGLNLLHEDNKRKQKIIIGSLLLVGILEMVYAYLQLFTTSKFVIRFFYTHMANGVSMNPNFFGHFLSLLLPLSIGLYIYNEKKYRFIFFICALIFSVGLVFAESIMPILSVIATMLFLLIYILVKHRKKIVSYLLIVICCTATFIYTNDKTMEYYIENNYYLPRYYTIDGGFEEIKNSIIKLLPSKENKEDTDTVVEENTTNIWDDNYSETRPDSGRIWLWKQSVHLLKENPWIGCGTDNFEYAVGNIDPTLRYLEAHNIYLNYAINNGIPATIIFIVLMAIVFFKGLKFKDGFAIALLLGFISYSICAIAGISVFPVATYYYVVFGLLGNYVIKKNKD